MRYDLKVDKKEDVIALASEIVYGQRVEWCGATWRPLCLSLMRPRQFFYYDPKKTLPVIIFLCGGGFTNVDRNVWIPELTWFAKRGYAVVSVEYSVTARTRFPMQIEDIKQAIRYIRAHANEYGLDTERMVIWGESAGAYLGVFTALSSNHKEYEVGEYLDQKSTVNGAIAFYTPADMSFVDKNVDNLATPVDVDKYISLPSLIDESAPPIAIFHGTEDSQVPLEQGLKLYDALQAKGIKSDIYVLEGAEHADAPFIQEEVKELILNFIKDTIG